jgi:hypothetical protein
MRRLIFNQSKEKSILIVAIILILLVGVFFSWRIYFETDRSSWDSFIPIIAVSLVIFLLGVAYLRHGVFCPQCKSKLAPHYERMENDKEAWIQIQYPCTNCDILWDTEVRGNVLRKFN